MQRYVQIYIVILFGLAGLVAVSLVAYSNSFEVQVVGNDVDAYLPIIHYNKDYSSEPNNSQDDANGPLPAEIVIKAPHNDEEDNYKFYLDTPGQIVVTLTTTHMQLVEAGGLQLQLYKRDIIRENRVKEDAVLPYTFSYDGQADWYFIRVFTDSAYVNDELDYTLHVSFPQKLPLPTPIPTREPERTATPIPTCPNSLRPALVGNAEFSGAIEFMEPDCLEVHDAKTQLRVGGSHSDLQHDANVWILVYSHESPVYWPQAIGGCEGNYINIGTDDWETRFILGGEHELFDVIAVVADEEASTFFKNWWAEGCATGNFPGLSDSEIRALNLQEKTSITVSSGDAPPPPPECPHTRIPLTDVGEFQGEITIGTPSDCRGVIPAKTSLTVAGSYADLRDDTHVWALVYSHKGKVYWPQAIDGCDGNYINKGAGRWETLFSLGAEFEFFDLVVIAADEDADTFLKNWWTKHCPPEGPEEEEGHFQGVSVSELQMYEIQEKAAVRLYSGTDPDPDRPALTPIPTDTTVPPPTDTPTPTPEWCKTSRTPLTALGDFAGEIDIHAPSNCADGIPARSREEIAGSYSNLSDDIYMWVLVYPHVVPEYWPQAINGCKGNYINRLSGDWGNQYTLGGENEIFDLVVIAADAEANTFFTDWWSSNCQDEKFSGISVSALQDLNIQEKASITVRSGANPAPTPTPKPVWCNTSREELSGSADLVGEITLDIPTNCADLLPMNTLTDIKGSYSKFSEGSEIWTLVHPHGSPHYWPQAIDGCKGLYTIRDNQTWNTKFTLGAANTIYDVVMIEVDQQGHQFFENWWATSCPDNSPGILATDIQALNVQEKAFVTVRSAEQP